MFLIVGKDKEIVLPNSFPDELKIIEKKDKKDQKIFWFEHFERNANIIAARIGVSTKGCTMYLTCGIPCSDCARGIINAGITINLFVKDVHHQQFGGTF